MSREVDERAAARERVKELTAEARRDSDRAAGEADVIAKVAAMPESDRVIAERIHAIVKASGPELSPKTWYGMPAYTKDGRIVFFFKAADKFKSRYATFGFEKNAALDDGAIWAGSSGSSISTSVNGFGIRYDGRRAHAIWRRWAGRRAR